MRSPNGIEYLKNKKIRSIINKTWSIENKTVFIIIWNIIIIFLFFILNCKYIDLIVVFVFVVIVFGVSSLCAIEYVIYFYCFLFCFSFKFHERTCVFCECVFDFFSLFFLKFNLLISRKRAKKNKTNFDEKIRNNNANKKKRKGIYKWIFLIILL